MTPRSHLGTRLSDELRVVPRRRGVPLLLGMVCFTLALFLATPCFAERVVLVRPIGQEPVLTEVFNRLQGELRMHGFETILASANGLPSSGEMQRVAELGQAAASVALERTELDSTAHVWFVDREASRARILSVAVPDSEDTPSLLALRTVELLRSTLRERSTEPPAKAPRPTTHVRTVPRSASPQRDDAGRLSVRGELGIASSSMAQPVVPDFAISFGYRIVEPWTLALRVQVPLKSNGVAAAGASATYRVETAMLESRWSLELRTRLTLEPLVAVGAARTTAAGSAARPNVSRDASGTSLVLATGIGAWFAVSSHVALGVALRAGLFGPKPVVRVQDRDQLLGRPWLDLGLGLNFAF